MKKSPKYIACNWFMLWTDVYKNSPKAWSHCRANGKLRCSAVRNEWYRIFYKNLAKSLRSKSCSEIFLVFLLLHRWCSMRPPFVPLNWRQLNQVVRHQQSLFDPWSVLSDENALRGSKTEHQSSGRNSTKLKRSNNKHPKEKKPTTGYTRETCSSSHVKKRQKVIVGNTINI